MIERGEKVADAPWSLFEELLCTECALYMGTKDHISTENLMEFYNKVAVLIKDNSIALPQDNGLCSLEMQKVELKEEKAITYLLNKLVNVDEEFKEQLKQQVDLRVKNVSFTMYPKNSP